LRRGISGRGNAGYYLILILGGVPFSKNAGCDTRILRPSFAITEYEKIEASKPIKTIIRKNTHIFRVIGTGSGIPAQYTTKHLHAIYGNKM